MIKHFGLMESMKGLFNGTKNLYIHANYANDIIDAIDISNDFYQIQSL